MGKILQGFVTGSLGLCLLSGCGTGSTDVSVYVAVFVEEAHARGVTLERSIPEITFSEDLPEGIGGTCNSDGSISLNKDYWFEMAEDQEREAVLLHELGHCLLGRAHTEALSLMRPRLDPELYRAQRGELLDELFQSSATRGAPIAAAASRMSSAESAPK